MTVPKDRTVRINLSTKGNSESAYTFEAYQLQGKKLKEVVYHEIKLGKDNGKVKLKKGTYYFVIESMGNIFGTGSYTVQWK